MSAALDEITLERLTRFEDEVGRFASGAATAAQFRSFRVPFGVYEQRRTGQFMLRIRITGGDIGAAQLSALAEVAQRHGSSRLHVTTRQDLQVHDVPLQRLHPALVTLAGAGLSTFGGGGNSVRNITACAMSGFCPRECFPVVGHTRALTRRLLGTPFAVDLPRKYKIAFSGCVDDCAGARTNDLGFVARTRNGMRGFEVHVAGGMGRGSRIGTVLETFVPEQEVFYVAEAVKRVFDRHGNRRNKHQARLRFLVEQLGIEQFVARYREALKEVRTEPPLALPVADAPPPATQATRTEVDDAAFSSWCDAHVVTQPQDGYHVVEIPLFLGDLDASTAVRLATVAESFGAGTLRTTQAQNLLLPWVKEEALPHVFAALAPFGLATPVPPVLSRMAVCAGASTCRLGICHSPGLARELRARLSASPIDLFGLGQVRLHISGCPNSCGRHLLGDIGLSGAARRIGGEIAPHYEVKLGGGVADKAAFAHGNHVLPAAAVPEALSDLLQACAEEEDCSDFAAFARGRGPSVLDAIAAAVDFAALEPRPGEGHVDWGADEPFSLAGRSPGECGAGVFDLIEIDLATAADALADGALQRAVVAASRALLVAQGVEAGTDLDALRAFQRLFLERGLVPQDCGAVIELALRAAAAGSPSAFYPGSREAVSRLVTEVRELYERMDQSLRFPNPGGEPLPENEAPAMEVDFRGVVCPLNFVKTRMALAKIKSGGRLVVLLDQAGARNVPASVKAEGHIVHSVTESGDHWRVVIERASPQGG